MLKTLRTLLRSQDPDHQVAAELAEMMSLVGKLVGEAGDVFWGAPCSDEQRSAFYARDRRVNALHQSIRKRMVGRLALAATMQHARLLVLMGLIKDIERLGDYAKNLLEAAAMLEEPLPDNDVCTELRAIREDVENVLSETHRVLETADPERAKRLTARGQETGARCDQLISRVARSEYPASIAVPVALAARYYKRIQKHLMNQLSTVYMPIHKIDYFE